MLLEKRATASLVHGYQFEGDVDLFLFLKDGLYMMNLVSTNLLSKRIYNY